MCGRDDATAGINHRARVNKADDWRKVLRGMALGTYGVTVASRRTRGSVGRGAQRRRYL